MVRPSGVENALARIASIPKITEANKKLMSDYADRMEALGRNPKTTEKHLLVLRKALELESNFNFKKAADEKATREEVERLWLKFKRFNPSETLQYDFVKVIKHFFKEMFMDGLGYPRSVIWLKLKTIDTKINSSDIFSEEEILKMIKTATSSRDKAIIAIGFDSGIRSGELLGMKRRDIDLDNDPAHITVTGKTGIIGKMRQIPLSFSVPYIARYLDDMKELGPNEFIWRNLAQSHIKGVITDDGLNSMLKEVAKSAGINKPKVHWHVLARHSRATYYANRLTEPQLKAFFGWTGKSKMTATYVHLSGRDIDNAIKRANGLEVNEGYEKPLLATRECPRCKMQNGRDTLYCGRCGGSLDISTALKKQESERNIKEAITESLSDPEVVKNLLPIIQEVLKERASKK